MQSNKPPFDCIESFLGKGVFGVARRREGLSTPSFRQETLQTVNAYATVSCFFARLPETVGLTIIPCTNGTPETLKEIKRRFV